MIRGWRAQRLARARSPTGAAGRDSREPETPRRTTKRDGREQSIELRFCCFLGPHIDSCGEAREGRRRRRSADASQRGQRSGGPARPSYERAGRRVGGLRG